MLEGFVNMAIVWEIKGDLTGGCAVDDSRKRYNSPGNAKRT